MMRNIAIIPARSGSKGIKDKNIKFLNGRPLISYSIQAAIESQMFDVVMVSTDSERYAEIALSEGAAVPWLRSSRLSSDSAKSWDVVREVLTRYADEGLTFDTVCLLQPTSPLRTSRDIKESYMLLRSTGSKAVTSVCETEHSPLWTTTLDSSLSLNEYRRKVDAGSDSRRQELNKYYRINGAIFIRTINYKIEAMIESLPETAYIMNRESSIDIDTTLDFSIASLIINGEELQC